MEQEEIADLKDRLNIATDLLMGIAAWGFDNGHANELREIVGSLRADMQFGQWQARTPADILKNDS